MKRIPEGSVRKGILPRVDTVSSLRIYHYLVPCVFFDRFRKKKSLIQREILKKVIDIYLMEHDEYGNEAASIIVDATGKLVAEDLREGSLQRLCR